MSLILSSYRNTGLLSHSLCWGEGLWGSLGSRVKALVLLLHLPGNPPPQQLLGKEPLRTQVGSPEKEAQGRSNGEDWPHLECPPTLRHWGGGAAPQAPEACVVGGSVDTFPETVAPLLGWIRAGRSPISIRPGPGVLIGPSGKGQTPRSPTSHRPQPGLRAQLLPRVSAPISYQR